MRSLFFIVFNGIWVSAASAAGDAGAGQRPYATVCAGCHGFAAEGNRDVGAPALANLEDWYLTRQIDYYHRGVRGAHPEDAAGARMAAASLALADQRALEGVVAYISILPDPRLAPNVQGDVSRGRSLYAPCASCHGLLGEGSAALSAPNVTGLDDWYIVSQLKAYQQGFRGAHSEDLYGQQMAPLMNALPDERALVDVAAYINTLRDAELDLP